MYEAIIFLAFAISKEQFYLIESKTPSINNEETKTNSEWIYDQNKNIWKISKKRCIV
jgi:hypothetical protein